jgi:hypothetical protein
VLAKITALPLDALLLKSAGSTLAFYITLTTTGMRNTDGNAAQPSYPYKEDANLQIFQGTGNQYLLNEPVYQRTVFGMLPSSTW